MRSGLDHLPMQERIEAVIAGAIEQGLSPGATARRLLRAMRKSTTGMILSCADLPGSQQEYWQRSIDAALGDDIA
jgi:CTP:molybdopterin cytidylyltransferase MocA